MDYKYNQVPEPPAAVEWPEPGVVSSCEACGRPIYVDQKRIELKKSNYHYECVCKEADPGDFHLAFAKCPECGDDIFTDEYFARAGSIPLCISCLEEKVRRGE